MTRTAIYTRVSEAREEEDSRVDQERRCRAYAEAKGWEVEHVFTDRGISAWSGADRPGWAALERAVDAGEVDAVLVFQVSRSARNVGRLHRFIELCRDRGVTFASASEGVDTSTAMGRLMATIVGALAELESEIRSERVRATIEGKRERGEWPGGRRPFGFRSHEGRLVVDEREGGLVREAASRFLSGETLSSVARWLSEEAPTPAGNPWGPSKVRGMLAAERHVGTTLTRRDHRRILAKLEEQHNVWTTHPRGDRYMLTGLLVCGRCGGRMVGRPDRGVRRYACYTFHLQVKADVVEDYVTRRAAEARVHREDLPAPAERTRELDEAEARLERWARDAAEAGLSPGEIRAGREPLLQVRDDIVAAMETSAPPAVRWEELAGLGDNDEPTVAEWRAYVESLVDHVTIGPNVADGSARAPSQEARVVITWREGVNA